LIFQEIKQPGIHIFHQSSSQIALINSHLFIPRISVVTCRLPSRQDATSLKLCSNGICTGKRRHIQMKSWRLLLIYPVNIELSGPRTWREP
jgi:hypothetical protein